MIIIVLNDKPINVNIVLILINNIYLKQYNVVSMNKCSINYKYTLLYINHECIHTYIHTILMNFYINTLNINVYKINYNFLLKYFYLFVPRRSKNNYILYKKMSNKCY